MSPNQVLDTQREEPSQRRLSTNVLLVEDLKGYPIQVSSTASIARMSRPAFTYTGVDFAGPLITECYHQRNLRLSKCGLHSLPAT